MLKLKSTNSLDFRALNIDKFCFNIEKHWFMEESVSQRVWLGSFILQDKVSSYICLGQEYPFDPEPWTISYVEGLFKTLHVQVF